MPNYITNRLKIVGDKKEVQEVLDYLKSEYKDENGEVKTKYINFNNIVPMPEELSIVDTTHPDEDLQQKYNENKKKYGHATWYGWCCSNWGTKWNAMETLLVDDDTIFFETAWGGVPDLIEKVAKKFPNLTFYYDFADEDISYNTGKVIYENGVMYERYPKGGSKEAYELCFDLGNACREDYKLVNDTYEWVNND